MTAPRTRKRAESPHAKAVERILQQHIIVRGDEVRMTPHEFRASILRLVARVERDSFNAALVALALRAVRGGIPQVKKGAKR